MSDPFSKSTLESLQITRFVFHVVHDDSEEPTLLEEIPIGDYEPFFLELVLDGAKGNRFLFNEGSKTREQLVEILEDDALFQEKSQILARNFHIAATGSASPGVFFFMRLSGNDRDYFALIKYDNQPVLRYSYGDGERVRLDELTNTITQNRSALQKSALVCLGGDDEELMVRDRQASGGDVAAYFKHFLGVRRKQGQEQITRALHRAAVDTVNKHAADLPDDLIRDASDRFADVVTQGPRDVDGFYNDYFGTDDPAVRDTFDQQMHRRGLDNDCPFELDPETASRPEKRRYATVGGITLQIPPGTQDAFEIRDCSNGDVEITIRTKKLWEK